MALTLKSMAQVVGETIVKESEFEDEVVVPTRKVVITKSQLRAQKDRLKKAIDDINLKLAQMAQMEAEANG